MNVRSGLSHTEFHGERQYIPTLIFEHYLKNLCITRRRIFSKICFHNI
jgi:hypothetical protein